MCNLLWDIDHCDCIIKSVDQTAAVWFNSLYMHFKLTIFSEGLLQQNGGKIDSILIDYASYLGQLTGNMFGLNWPRMNPAAVMTADASSITAITITMSRPCCYQGPAPSLGCFAFKKVEDVQNLEWQHMRCYREHGPQRSHTVVGWWTFYGLLDQLIT